MNWIILLLIFLPISVIANQIPYAEIKNICIEQCDNKYNEDKSCETSKDPDCELDKIITLDKCMDDCQNPNQKSNNN